MAEDNGFAMGYALGQDSGGNNGGGWGNFGEGIWAVVIIALLFGRGGFGGGLFGGGGGGEGVSAGFAWQGIDNGIRGIQQGLCDGFYAVNTGLLTGFNGVERGLAGLGSQLANCCCETQRAIDGVNYNMATQFCALGNTVQSSARDIIENQNAGVRSILDFLVNDKISTLTAENQSLKFAASQAAQNAFIAANQDAQTAELIRRIAPMPVPSYTVPAPYPYGYGGYGNSGCGCA